MRRAATLLQSCGAGFHRAVEVIDCMTAALFPFATETIITPDVSIVRYPFVREMREAHWLGKGDGAPHPEIECWIPGITHVAFGPEDTEAVAHGEGEMHLRIVSTHKPGRYPERVFYERCFVDPDGTTFSRPKLHIATRSKFNRLCKGYQVGYRVVTNEEVEL